MKTTDKNIISPEGYLILLISFVGAILLFVANGWLGLFGCFWFCFAVYFFRNPKRVLLQEAGIIVSPADGTVIFCEETTEPHFLNQKMQKVSVFMSPFNVHVNRVPVSGTVRDKKHFRGKYLKAFAADASLHNERCATQVKTEKGDDIVFVQVAGWFARRIINYLSPSDKIVQGSIFGVIKFGSRSDVYLPKNYVIAVKPQDKVKSGETIIARIIS